MITNFSWLLSVSIKFSSVTLCNQSEESDMSFVTLSFIAETFLFLYVVWAILTWFSVYANVELCFRFPMQVAWSFSLPMLSTLTWTQKLLITHTYKPTKTLLRSCWPSEFLEVFIWIILVCIFRKSFFLREESHFLVLKIRKLVSVLHNHLITR